MLSPARYRTIATCVLLAAAGCEHDAWLGMQCAEWGVRCDDAGPAARSGAAVDMMDAGAQPAKSDTVTGASPATSDAQMPALADAGLADAAVTATTCRSVSMTFFACANGAEMAGAPRLQGGGAYTLRLRGAYEVDTTFQVQGSTSACSVRMFGNITLIAGEPVVERCITPYEDLALLVTVVSGDVQVWMQNGIQAEICDGCE
jgi:hypothetical protein